MRYLLVKEKGKRKYTLYCPDVYGIESWGSTSQDSLVKKKKYWYIHCWSAGNEWIEDTNEEYKLNVVVETSDLDEILRYLFDHGVKDVESIINEARNLYNDYLDMILWFLNKN